MTRDAHGGEPEPIWRRDFPYTSAGEDAVTRREFARYLVLASGAFAAGTVGIAAWASARELPEGEPTPVIAVDDIRVGDTYLFSYPGADDPAILIRLGEDEFVAFSQKCTHLGCVVFAEGEHLECPCHEGFFDIRTGQVTSGPPERPLEQFAVEVRDDGRVWVLGRIETEAEDA